MDSIYESTKRLFDVVAAASAAVVLGPVVVVAGAVVRATLGKPVLYFQERPGRHGEVFTMVKLRTMLPVDESRGVVTNEQRMTRVGRALRATSIDELPGLWNVIRGDMSLVGPRPLLVDYLPLYSARQARRHGVRPGLTGLAQVSGRNALDWDSRLELDVQYVENRCWSLDLTIIARTVWKVLRREGIATEGHSVGAPFRGSAGLSAGTSGR